MSSLTTGARGAPHTLPPLQTQGGRNPASEISHWLQYINCALVHEHIPRGRHMFASTVSLPQDMKDIYQCLYKLYTECAASVSFREPVNALELGILHYYNVVEQPMSLRVILDRIVDGGHYSNPQQVLADVNVIWKNCIAFNGEQSSFAAEALKCQQELQRLQMILEDNQLAPEKDASDVVDAITALDNEAVFQSLLQYFMREDPTMVENSELMTSRLTVKHVKAMRKIVDDEKQRRAASSSA